MLLIGEKNQGQLTELVISGLMYFVFNLYRLKTSPRKLSIYAIAIEHTVAEMRSQNL